MDIILHPNTTTLVLVFCQFASIIITIIIIMSFSHQHKQMVFNWSLRDRKSLLVFWTLLSILTDLNNALVLMVRPSTSNSSSPLTVSSPRIIIGITVIFSSYYYYFPVLKPRPRMREDERPSMREGNDYIHSVNLYFLLPLLGSHRELRVPSKGNFLYFILDGVFFNGISTFVGYLMPKSPF